MYLPVIVWVSEMGRVFGTHGKKRGAYGVFKWASLKGGDQWENVTINGRIILN